MEASKFEKIAKNDLNEELIRACQAGDREAFHALYDCFKRKVYSLALYMTGDGELAKDLTSEKVAIAELAR